MQFFFIFMYAVVLPFYKTCKQTLMGKIHGVPLLKVTKTAKNASRLDLLILPASLVSLPIIPETFKTHPHIKQMLKMSKTR